MRTGTGLLPSSPTPKKTSLMSWAAKSWWVVDDVAGGTQSRA